MCIPLLYLLRRGRRTLYLDRCRNSPHRQRSRMARPLGPAGGYYITAEKSNTRQSAAFSLFLCAFYVDNVCCGVFSIFNIMINASKWVTQAQSQLLLWYIKKHVYFFTSTHVSILKCFTICIMIISGWITLIKQNYTFEQKYYYYQCWMNVRKILFVKIMHRTLKKIFVRVQMLQ